MNWHIVAFLTVLLAIAGFASCSSSGEAKSCHGNSECSSNEYCGYQVADGCSGVGHCFQMPPAECFSQGQADVYYCSCTEGEVGLSKCVPAAQSPIYDLSKGCHGGDAGSVVNDAAAE